MRKILIFAYKKLATSQGKTAHKKAKGRDEKREPYS
jgi:hypothetical protein